ncbi:unnamed protein product [Phytophthora fragariaefolia]|uniref:Unnamed protein product n=1 Tax=Phytophthora fragariaefolia TaxID=1490495 RepID=A0A9W7DE36_9STRA|nr:unnamed protein product [Phytophthora fragariaefolia]
MTYKPFGWLALKPDDVTAFDEYGPTHGRPRGCSGHLYPIGRLEYKPRRTAERSHVVMLWTCNHTSTSGALLLNQARKGLSAYIPVAVYMSENGRPSCVSAVAKVARVIKRAAHATGEDSLKLSTHSVTHSVRAGNSTNMYRAGINALTIQFHRG